MNDAPITGSTNFVDRTPEPDVKATYVVCAVGKKTRVTESGPVTVGERVEVGGVRRIKVEGAHTKAQKVGVADLDGDGKFDTLVKHPDFNVDPFVLGGGRI